MYSNINNSSKFHETNKKCDPIKNRGYFRKEQLASDEQEIKNQKLLKWKQELDQQLQAKKQEEQQNFLIQKEQERKEEQKRKIQLEQIQMQYLKEQGNVQGKSQQYSSEIERSFQRSSKKRNPNVQSGDDDFQKPQLKNNNERTQIYKYSNYSEKENNVNQQDQNQIQNEELTKHIQNDFRSLDITRINYANHSQDVELLKGLLNHQQHLFKNQLSSLRENVKQMQYNKNNAMNNMAILGNKARINQLNKIYEQDNSSQLQNKLIFNTNGSSNILNPQISSYFRNINQNPYLQYNGLQSLQQKPLKFDQFGNLNLDEFKNSSNKEYDQNGNLFYEKTQTYFDQNDNIQVQKINLQSLLQDNKNQDYLQNEELLANSRFYQNDEQIQNDQKFPKQFNNQNKNEDQGQEQTKTPIFSEKVYDEIKNQDNNFTKNNEIENNHDEKPINSKCNDTYDIKHTDENSNNYSKKNDVNYNEEEIQEKLQNQQLNQTDYSQEQQLKYMKLENMNQS
ncbi:hypothetical protein PPERSA_06357 [Pseudocohnilembus persalinus]|uniref:Uncharacterized protein n=1 Tax=Pseudocohnilembus persalinus TaxID=266149 RepID=A0A0V0QIU5_PSEPJ|nr:hypothetical protein PPERSA_06357 [Pseudocohnilembus persalinus]|eukprot:KRX02162.1 hypothetical protein PPERSA_06357 [Pseudocohnilembus persalinus]